jgi:hypothetical protein
MKYAARYINNVFIKALYINILITKIIFTRRIIFTYNSEAEINKRPSSVIR